jgi:hypothetical protein
MASNTKASGMPLVLEMKIHLKTDCYDNIEFVATGAMGNSQNWFGVFTDTVKFPLHMVRQLPSRPARRFRREEGPPRGEQHQIQRGRRRQLQRVRHILEPGRKLLHVVLLARNGLTP